MKKREAKPTRQNKQEVAAINAVARYLKSIGWSAMVGGFTGIERHGPTRYKFRLIFEFVGGKKAEKVKK